MISKLDTNYFTRGNLSENINNGRTERRKLSMDSNSLYQKHNNQKKPLKPNSLTNSLAFLSTSPEKVDTNTSNRTHNICTGTSFSLNKCVQTKDVSKKINVDSLCGKLDGILNKQYEQPLDIKNQSNLSMR